MENPLVSIIVPCYNQSHYLSESLTSVLEQTFSNWECIVVNDGSPDDTDDVVKQWLEKDSRFRYIAKENGGLSSARNAGITISKGVYILPLDADDILHKDCIDRMVSIIGSKPHVGIVSCYSKFFRGRITDVVHELKPKGGTYKSLLYENQIVATSLYRRHCWEAINGYDESMKKGFEDWEYWLRLLKRGYDYYVIPEFLFYYRKAKQSMLIDTINNHAESNKLYIMTKHKELYIEDFDNCLKVLFYYINTHKTSEMRMKTSLAYKVSKLIVKPFKLLKLNTGK